MVAIEPPSETDILIYAELLANIRQITIKASLPSPANHTTLAEILDDGRKFRISHNGLTEQLHLPANVSVKGALPLSHKNSVDLTWRIPLRPAALSERRFLPENQVLPWSASDLKHGSVVSCRDCGQEFVASGTIAAWKDLPSENWAEMMEFWHCHKPVEHDKPENGSLQHRGYGAASHVVAQPNVGFVDITSFLFSESDCRHVKFSSSASEKYESSNEAIQASGEQRFINISCSKCDGDIGMFSVLASTTALFKWAISCQAPDIHQAPSSSDCLVATLLSTISRSGSSKSVIMPRIMSTADRSSRHLQLWVLNNNVLYSSNRSKQMPTSAVKVLFKDIEEKQALDLVESLSNDVQDIAFPASAIQAARENLASSQLLLPLSERSFQEWQVGLLERWNPP